MGDAHNTITMTLTFVATGRLQPVVPARHRTGYQNFHPYRTNRSRLHGRKNYGEIPVVEDCLSMGHIRSSSFQEISGAQA